MISIEILNLDYMYCIFIFNNYNINKVYYLLYYLFI